MAAEIVDGADGRVASERKFLRCGEGFEET